MFDRVGETRGVNAKGEKVYTLTDVYPHADLVTYPSLYEGFGNAFSGTTPEIRAIIGGGNTIIQGDIDGDGNADLELMLLGVTTASPSYFV